ncbi:glycosyltransferase [Acidocella aromatica]|uniref:Glycosyltransferase involved in cell wall biosynthesis n=1 Tax=Acidocella aromatica TaxID=1303579 RepID=A0A840VCC6_9PROT|nr:glycosyltransferase [Acidocella aromatica]MBB5373304.1 glycosyltransferase involved in cell wall biosynthesis [Acidocella aromatica]
MTLPARAAHAGKIAILLSTYNGARFLPAQLNSFLAQTHEDWVLHWRDDGSTDETVDIMRAFAAKVGAERCVESPSSGPHLGASPSFFILLQENIGAHAVAFADQDDVWLPEKLAGALAMLEEAADAPALYCSRQYLVDESLRGAKLSAQHGKAPGFPACLTQNIANGNTVVMNASAAALVASSDYPANTVHDWWSYIVVSACGGRILFDERPQVLYRLHKSNLIGRAKPLPARALAALRRGPRVYMTMMHRHADALAAQTVRLAPQARRDLRLVRAGLHGGLLERMRALFCPRFRRRTLLENLLFTYWFLTSPATQPEAISPPGWQPAEQPPPARKLHPR